MATKVEYCYSLDGNLLFNIIGSQISGKKARFKVTELHDGVVTVEPITDMPVILYIRYLADCFGEKQSNFDGFNKIVLKVNGVSININPENAENPDGIFKSEYYPKMKAYKNANKKL